MLWCALIYCAIFCFSWGWVSNYVNFSCLCFFEWLSVSCCTLNALWNTSLVFHTAWTVIICCSSVCWFALFFLEKQNSPSLYSHVDWRFPSPLHPVPSWKSLSPLSGWTFALPDPRPSFPLVYYPCLVRISICLTVYLLLLRTCFH